MLGFQAVILYVNDGGVEGDDVDALQEYLGTDDGWLYFWHGSSRLLRLAWHVNLDTEEEMRESDDAATLVFNFILELGANEDDPTKVLSWNSLFAWIHHHRLQCDNLHMHANALRADPTRQKEADAVLARYQLCNPQDIMAYTEVVNMIAILTMCRRVIKGSEHAARCMNHEVPQDYLEGETLLNEVFHLVMRPLQNQIKVQLFGIMEAFCSSPAASSNERREHVWPVWENLHNRSKAGIFEKELSTEDKDRQYSVTTAITSLLQAVLPCAHLRVPQAPPPPYQEGYSVYTTFLTEAFRRVSFNLKHPHAKTDPRERKWWVLCEKALQTMKTLLEGSGGAFDNTALQRFQEEAGKERAGFDLINQLLGPDGEDPPDTINHVFDIIAKASHGGSCQFRYEPEAFKKSVLLSLQVLHQLFLQQHIFEKSGGRRIEDMIGDTGHQRIKNLLELLYDGFSPEIKLASVKVINELVGRHSVFSTVYSSVREIVSPDILDSWNQCIRDIGIEETGDGNQASMLLDVAGNDMHTTIDNALGFSVVHMLLRNMKLKHRKVGFAHLLLGFSSLHSSARNLSR